MKRWMACLLALSLLTGSCAMAQEENQCALWRVQNGDVTVYLLGSIHIGSERMYPFSQAVQDAMAQADEFVFECDTTSGDAMVAMQLAMCYTDGTKLSQVIGQELFDTMKAACDKVGFPTMALEAYKPWAVSNTLSIYAGAIELGVKDIGAVSEYGVENQIYAMLGEDQRPVSYLENTADQIALMESFSNELQRYMLAGTCEMILHPTELTDNPIRHWEKWWIAGDTQSFAQSYLDTYLEKGYEAFCQEYHDELVTKRNIGMANGVEAMLKGEGKKTYFVTVGLLHLALPDDSVIKVLQDRGYVVDRVR